MISGRRERHLMQGFTTAQLLRLARRNGVGPRPRQFLDFSGLLASSCWWSLLAALERRFSRGALERTPVPQDPLVIVGHWRTGSTFLHQLLQLHPDLAAPTLVQAVLPECMLLADRFVAPVMARMLPRTRPMDNVRVAAGEPLEDEFALFRMTGNSPLERIFFSRRGRRFLVDEAPAFLDEDERERWEAALLLFVRKIHLATGKRIVLKNPFHSLRISILRRLFPGARFIHIHRDPREVIPSAIRMWTILGKRNCLRGTFVPPSLEEAVAVFDRLVGTIHRDLSVLPADAWTSVRFADLEEDPPATLTRLCRSLGLPEGPLFRSRIGDFLSGTAGYRKNSLALSSRDRDYISRALRDHLVRDGYPLS